MVIDTNIIIAYLNAEPRAVVALSDWKQEGRGLFVSSISIAETLAISSLTEIETSQVKEFLKNFISVPLDNTVAEVAGYLRRKYKLEIPDAAIAATALTKQVPLVTRDRQFRKVREIILLEI